MSAEMEAINPGTWLITSASTNHFSGKNSVQTWLIHLIMIIITQHCLNDQTLSILAVLRGHNGLIWMAAEGALACLLLENIVATSFAIQLLAASKDD